MTNNNLVYLFIGLSITLVIGATYSYNLKDYKEECFEYHKENYTANWSMLDYKDGNRCYMPYGYWGLNCSIVTKYWYFNSTRDSDKCLKYHLVRYNND